jgi:hypothetical protein
VPQYHNIHNIIINENTYNLIKCLQIIIKSDDLIYVKTTHSLFHYNLLNCIFFMNKFNVSFYLPNNVYRPFANKILKSTIIKKSIIVLCALYSIRYTYMESIVYSTTNVNLSFEWDWRVILPLYNIISA